MKLSPIPSCILSLLTLMLSPLTTANTEKTIFLGPPKVNLPASHPSLSSLLVDTLTPESSTSSIVRTQLNASFPRDSPYLASLPISLRKDDADELGTPSWFILDDLVPGQRYEVRVCWAATQPTAFRLETFPIDTVFETSELASSLSAYSYARHAQPLNTSAAPDAANQDEERMRRPAGTEIQRSVLFLRIHAAADYFSLDKALMTSVPPVRVDVILDPFLFNVLPRSLLPIVGYIIVVAAASWFLAGWVSRTIREVALQPEQDKKKQ